MSMVWTTIEDETLREALRLNPNVGAAALEDRFPIRSRGSITKRLRALRGCPVHELREPSEPSKRRALRRALRRASGIAPPLGYYPAEIEWAKATEHNPKAPPIQRLEARLILSLHENRERWAR